jgi:hypothetical protein
MAEMPRGVVLKLGPTIRTDMFKLLLEDYPDLKKRVTNNSTKNEIEAILRESGNTFKAFLVRREQNSIVHFYLIPIELRTTDSKDFAKIPNYKSFLTGLKSSSVQYNKKYGNTFSTSTLNDPNYASLSEKEKLIIEKFVSDPSEYKGCQVYTEVIASGAEASDHSDGEPEITPTYKSLNILEGSRFGKNIRLPRYSRTDNADSWVDKCVMILQLSGVTNETRIISQLVTELSEETQDLVLTEMASDPVMTIHQFKKILRRCARLSDNEITRNLAALKFDEKNHKNFRNFFYKLKSLVQCQLPDGTDSSLIERVAIREFTSKVPQVIAGNTYFRNYPVKDSNQLIDLADNIWADSKGPKSSTELNFVQTPKTGSNDKSSKDLYCSICKKKGHSTYKCFFNPKNPSNRLKGDKQEDTHKGKRKDSKDVKCYRCGMKGHISRNCRTALN